MRCRSMQSVMLRNDVYVLQCMDCPYIAVYGTMEIEYKANSHKLRKRHTVITWREDDPEAITIHRVNIPDDQLSLFTTRNGDVDSAPF